MSARIQPASTLPATDRAAFRAFVLANHPDVGGDVETFVAGLERFRAAGVRGRPDDNAGERRYDAPVVGVQTPRGLRRPLGRWRRWHDRRNRPPRVR